MKTFHVTNLPQALTRFLTLLFLTLTLAACGGGGDGFPGYRTPGTGTAVALNVAAPSSVTVALGSAQSYSISGGTAPYKIVSGNTIVSLATLQGTDTLSIPGSAVGTAQVVVYDSANKSVTINVTVASTAEVAAIPLNVFAPGSVQIVAGAPAQTYAISGGTTPYKVVSNNVSVSAASLVDTNTLSISGSSVGSALVYVFDALGKSFIINVAVTSSPVAALNVMAPGSVTTTAGATALTYAISGGTAPYTVVSSNVSVSAATLSGTNTLVIPGTGAGTAQVVVYDSANHSVAINVTVQSAAAPVLAPLSIIAPSSVSVALNGSESYAITGGKAPYTVVSSNTTVSAATLSGSSTLVIPGSAMGTAQVVVTDANGNTATIAVTVSIAGQSSVALYTTAPITINIAAGTTTSYYIGGGKQPYSQPVSSDVRYATATATGTNSSILNITGVAAGTAQVVVTDAVGTAVAISVTVH